MLKLVRLTRENYPLLVDMMDEWTSTGEVIVPWAIRKADYRDYDTYAASLETGNPGTPGGNIVPDSTFFCLDTEQNCFVGAVNIRHYLNNALLKNGGHIGDGVRPSQRRKGIATRMIALALDECRKLGISRVLMTCDSVNIGSAKSIINNGGVLENEIVIDGETVQRYWIQL